MVHFGKDDWRAFANGVITEEKLRIMEEHLLKCDQCAEEYLSCFSEENTSAKAVELHPQFTYNVMREIYALEAKGKKRTKQRTMFYYSATACLTILLMAVGFFEGFAGIVPGLQKSKFEAGITIGGSLDLKDEKLIEFGWSDKLMDNALTLIDTIKSKGAGDSR